MPRPELGKLPMLPARLSIFTAVSMLIGAFIAAAAAALGGPHRDEDWRAHPGLQQRA